jgi:hypothetical protein
VPTQPGASAASQPVQSRELLRVQVFAPLGPVAAWTRSAYSSRLPARFQRSVNPVGGLIATLMTDESIDTHPTSMAFATDVVTPGIVAVFDMAPPLDADWTAPSIDAVVLTPEYRAIAPEFATAELSVHV